MLNNIQLLAILLPSVLNIVKASDVCIESMCSLLPGQLTGRWNTENVGTGIRSWLESLVTVSCNPKDCNGMRRPQSRLFNREDGTYHRHFARFEDSAVQYSNPEDRTVITVGHFTDEGIPVGPTWQWVSRYRIDGFLYGNVDSAGQFSGPNITFIYPDFQTGLHGVFNNGRLVRGVEVDITAFACREGMLEIKLQKVRSTILWKGEEQTENFIGSNPFVMDPYEKKGVFVAKSSIDGANEGLFARKDFFPGDLLSYYSGVKIIEQFTKTTNLSQSIREDFEAYMLDLQSLSPSHWNVPNDLIIDLPREYRSLRNFTTTLAHKANHKFWDTNSHFDAVIHPVFGQVGCLLADDHIKAGEEIFVNYRYADDVMDNQTSWYGKLKRIECSRWSKNGIC